MKKIKTAIKITLSIFAVSLFLFLSSLAIYFIKEDEIFKENKIDKCANFKIENDNTKQKIVVKTAVGDTSLKIDKFGKDQNYGIDKFKSANTAVDNLTKAKNTYSIIPDIIECDNILSESKALKDVKEKSDIKNFNNKNLSDYKLTLLNDNISGEVIESTDSTETESENAEKSPIYEFLDKELLPIFSGVITAIMALLALVIPFIKTLGKLKTARAAYTTVYDENEKLMEIAKNYDIESVKNQVTECAVKAVNDKFKAYDAALGNLLKETELTSAQIATLIEGAKIAWKEADGASVALCKAPSSSVLNKQSLTLDFLKTFIAEQLGIKREELELKIDEEFQK